MIINEFRGAYFFLSNFYPAPVEYENIEYGNNEAAFQAMKTLDLKERRAFAYMEPSTAKSRGRSVKLRNNWEEVKEQYMYEICKAKFEQNHDLKGLLLVTGDSELIEGNYWHDNYYGNCLCAKCKSVIGKNILGKILTRVREELK